MSNEPETGVFRSPSGLIRLDIPRAGTNLRELFDAKVEAGELAQIPDDSVREVVEVYGRDKDGNEQTLTRLELVDPPPSGVEKRAALGNEDPDDEPRSDKRPRRGRPTNAQKAAREAEEAAREEAREAERGAEVADAEPAPDADADDDSADDDGDGTEVE